MADSLSSATIENSQRTEASAPDWALVPFEVDCARCGYDLRGLTEPRCPACKLEFDWAEAVPLEHLTCPRCDYHLFGLQENRCPECGDHFAWPQVLDEYRRRRKPLFEYRWRAAPLRSLYSAWKLALRPWKLWRVADIHDPPVIGGLFALLTGTTLGLTCVLLILSIGGRAVCLWVSSWATPGVGIFLGAPNAFGRPFIAPWMYGSWYWLPVALFTLLTWGVCSLGSLLLLRTSMAVCRVRNAHVFRVVIHTSLIAATGLAVIAFCMWFHDLVASMRPGTALRAFSPWMIVVIMLSIWTWAMLSIALGYRLYLRMPHAFAVAILTQMVAVLLMPIVVGIVGALLRLLF